MGKPGARLVTWVPVLPTKALSPNGGKRSRRDPWSVAEAKLELGDATYHAVLEAHGPAVPALNPPVTLYLIAYIKHHARPGDDYYRSTDVANWGGDILKPICDAFVRLGVLEDDNYKIVSRVVMEMRHVDDLAAEGFMVELEEAP